MNEFASHFKLIIGLGNPGKRYASTYHNIGSIAVDFLSDSCFQTLGKSDVAWETPSSKHFTFVRCGSLTWIKPTLFMNESGKAVQEAIAFFGADPSSEIAIFHDDSDLAIGHFKISTGQGAAGHHGIESVIHALGTKAFTRIRIGIRKDIGVKAGSMVLSKIPKRELPVFYSVCEDAMKKLIEKK